MNWVFWSYLKPNGLKLQDTHILWLIYSTEKNEKNIILLLCTGIKYKVFIRISSWEDRRIIPVSFHQRWSLYQHQLWRILAWCWYHPWWCYTRQSLKIMQDDNVLSILCTSASEGLHWYVQTILTGQRWRRLSLIGAIPTHVYHHIKHGPFFYDCKW